MYYRNVWFFQTVKEKRLKVFFAVVVFGSFPPLPSGGKSQLHPRNRGKKEEERAKVTSHTDRDS